MVKFPELGLNLYLQATGIVWKFAMPTNLTAKDTKVAKLI